MLSSEKISSIRVFSNEIVEQLIIDYKPENGPPVTLPSPGKQPDLIELTSAAISKKFNIIQKLTYLI